METGNRWTMAGMEVPLLTTDSVEWHHVAVPSASSPSTSQINDHPICKDFSSCCIIEDPSSYFMWSTSKSRPNSLEIIELCPEKEISRIGLRITFPDSLFPFAFICKDEYKFSSRNQLVLYTLTISGEAYLIRLRDKFDYGTSATLSVNEFIVCSTQASLNNGEITAVATTAGLLLVGRSDGSIACFQLSFLDPNSLGFLFELRDDSGFGLLRGLLSRSPTLAAVRDLVISEVQHRKFLSVLHSDGSIRVWDLLSRGKIFGQTRKTPTSEGEFLRLWVGDANKNCTLPVAMLHRLNTEARSETISLCGLHCNLGDRVSLTLVPWSGKITLEEGGTIDVKLSPDKVWVLNEGGVIMKDLFRDHLEERLTYYTLLEDNISELLFQSSENSSDDLLWLSLSVFSSVKEEIAPFLSSIFLRSLLLPGVFCNPVLRQTLGDYNKSFTDSEFGLLTVDGLKREILSVIDYQGASSSPVSTLHRWSSFCAHYASNWCKQNVACGLFLDPLTGAFGLIRKNGISIFRGLEDAECVIHGVKNAKVYSPGLEFDQEILLEVLSCAQYLRQQLGKPSSAVFYASLIRSAYISTEEVVSCFLKILESGYSSSAAPFLASEMGLDTAWKKEFLNRGNLRKFSVNMYLSLLALYHKSCSWSKILDVIESYLKFLVPQKINSAVNSNSYLNGSSIVQTTSQISKMMLESCFDVLMLLSYITRISGQIKMSSDDDLRVRQVLLPIIQEIVMEWHIINFLVTNPSESPQVEDFDYQLSALQIGGNVDKRLWVSRIGKCEFSLGFILLLSWQSSSGESQNISYSHLPNPNSLISLSREFTSWMIWGRGKDESSLFFSNAIEVGTLLLRHGQLNAAEYLLTLLDACLRKEKTFESLQSVDCKSSALFHLLGCCLVIQSRNSLYKPVQNRKVGEAIRCYFRAASMEGFSNTLQCLPLEAGWLHVVFENCSSSAACKLRYFEWVMQLFEQYSLSDAAWKFALAALEQVDEAFEATDYNSRENIEESVISKKGKLWANVFKFTLDLNKYHDAYCSIISNPDEESKNICLRRLIIVLYDRGAIKMLCNGQLPLIGLMDKVEQELARKAEYSDLSTKPNPFKLLYAFEMHRHNWARAATSMYLYSERLKTEVAAENHQMKLWSLQERLNALAVAINALQLVSPAHAWIAAPVKEASLDEESYPSKRARITKQELSPFDDRPPQNLPSYLSVEKLEEEFVLTSAEYSITSASIEWTFHGHEKPTAELIDILVESNLYDMAFTVILKFWKGSQLQSELERIFTAMALSCCLSHQSKFWHRNDQKIGNLLLTASENELTQDLPGQQTTAELLGDSPWERLEHYLDKYKVFHPRLPSIIARTLLSADPQIEIPIWLIRHFTVENSKTALGMAGKHSDPAALFRLYVEYGRFTEAVKLLTEYLEGLASVQGLDIIRRKKPFAVWLPYTSIERLWIQLNESIRLGQRTDQCEKLKNQMRKALVNHLSLVESDSKDLS